MDDLELGRGGENRAADFLTGLGYQLLAKNLHFKQGEIDLLMRDGNTIVLIEVKTQRRQGTFTPLDRIHPKKQAKLRLLAGIIAEKYPGQNIRIDIITLYWGQPELTHLKDVL